MSSPCHPAPLGWQQGHSKPSSGPQQPHLTFHPPAPERANRQDFTEMKPGDKSKAASPLEMLVEPKPVGFSGSLCSLSSPGSWTGPRTSCLTHRAGEGALNIPRENAALLLALGSSTGAKESRGVALQGRVTPPPLSLGSNSDTPGGI